MTRKNFTNHQHIKTKLQDAASFIIVLLFVNLFLLNKSFGQNTQVFTSNGTFTLPPGVTSITIEAWGGGAGGNSFAGGGGGGAYSKITIANPNSSYSVVVGQGGSAGNDGTSSTFGSVLTANGANGTAGGVASIGAGITSYKGGNGASGFPNTNKGGGAGASAAGAGADASGSTGGVGVSPGGSGGNGSSSGNGNPGSPYGGGGGSRGSSGTSGSGANGAVIVTWCPAISASATKTDITCFNAGDGTITITGSGGASPYMFSIDNTTNYNATVIAGASYVPIDAGSGKFINLPVGTYKIRVKDANGCESKPVQ